MLTTRRGMLLGAAASLSFPDPIRANPSNSRLVVVILRGAMDGLSAVVPYGDAYLRTWRPSLVLPEPGQDKGLFDLGGFWGLHPELRTVHALYQANQVLPIQAVAGPNRSRSHFEAQDMLEIGASQRLDSGWLNRLAALLPDNPNCDVAFSAGSNAPLILHGPAQVATWDPFHNRPSASASFYQNIARMHAADPLTGTAIADAIHERKFIDPIIQTVSYDGLPNGFPRLSRAAASLLAAPDGPRVAELELDGWDTHVAQVGRLTESLRTLDQGIAVLRAGLDAVWDRTVILVVTEFGRTVRVNGTSGTDHGTATAAFLIGGAVAGGRVLADWPGLKRDQLFEDRDLQPTIDIRAVQKSVLASHFGVKPKDMASIFPGSEAIAPVKGLVRS